jgi:archaellum component FlaC
MTKEAEDLTNQIREVESERDLLAQEIGQLKEVKLREFEVELLEKNNEINKLKGTIKSILTLRKNL